jgi:hypothetical protein
MVSKFWSRFLTRKIYGAKDYGIHNMTIYHGKEDYI